MLVRPVFLAALLFLAMSLLGQRPQQPTSQPAKPTSTPDTMAEQPTEPLAKLTANANLVLVPVIVTDKSGKHVLGLQKDAFRVEENGKPHPIAIFREVKTEKLTTNKASSAEGHSNFVVGEEQPRRLTAIVLDMLNTPSMRQPEAKKRLIDYLLRSATPDEPMAIFGLNGSGLRQLHPFTTDTKVLLAALQQLKISLSSEERTGPQQNFNNDQSEQQQTWDDVQFMSDFMQELDDRLTASYQRTATRTTLLAMTQIARALQGISGRKTLIWASAGFPFTVDDPSSFGRQGDDLVPQYQQAWRALNSADIAVYPVDLSTLNYDTKALPSANSGVSSTQVNNIRGLNGPKSALRLPYDKDSQQLMTLRAFADATGGRTCVTLEELNSCIAKAIEDSRSYYLVGYYLGPNTQPGWRKLKVTVAGSGLRVRSRNGFYVTPPAEDSPELRRQQLADALASPVQYTAVQLRARLMQAVSAPSSGTSGSDTLTAEFMLEVMGDSLSISNQNGIDLEIMTVALDSGRKTAASDHLSVNTELKPDAVQRIRQASMGIKQELDLPVGKYEVKFAVRDNPSGQLGTVTVPINLK